MPKAFICLNLSLGVFCGLSRRGVFLPCVRFLLDLPRQQGVSLGGGKLLISSRLLVNAMAIRKWGHPF